MPQQGKENETTANAPSILLKLQELVPLSKPETNNGKIAEWEKYKLIENIPITNDPLQWWKSQEKIFH